MSILITAPSLDINKNVSGIAAVVSTIIKNNTQQAYIHFVAGKEDKDNSIGARIKAIINSYKKLFTLLKDKAINLVHLNLAMNPKSLYRDYLIFKIARISHVRIIVHLHGGKYLLYKPKNIILKKIARSILTGANAVVCLSNMEKQIVEQVYNLKKVYVLENTIDSIYLNNYALHKQGEYTKILFMGRLHESKGIQVILNAIRQLMNAGYAKLYFIFCGAGPLENDIQACAKLCPNNVAYHGIATGDAKLEILRTADIFILPSLYGEGLPISLLEAMASGVIPIVTDDGSMKTLVKDGETGVIIEKNNASKLSNAIVELYNNREKMCKISANAHNLIAQNFSINHYVAALNKIYTQILN